MNENIIWTMGHSTRTLEEFVALLQSFDIKLLVDIRNYPGSRRYPHFNKDALQVSLPANGIQYAHLQALGGRRKPVVNSKNNAWKNDAFRGYADYMETGEFNEAVEELERAAQKERTAIMCSEAVWWRCHRSLVSDYLKASGWKVMHIMGLSKDEEHPYTSPAKIVKGKLNYAQPGSLF